LQEDDFDEWQDGPGPSNGAGIDAAAAGGSMPAAGQQADVGEEEDEEWEEV
jgi:hypothetical protein